MNEEERKLQENIKRVGMNLGVLLDIGLFPGQHALGLQECKGMVKAMVDDATAKLTSLAPPPPPTSPFPAPSSSSVG